MDFFFLTVVKKQPSYMDSNLSFLSGGLEAILGTLVY